jgi:hypothetical protein
MAPRQEGETLGGAGKECAALVIGRGDLFRQRALGIGIDSEVLDPREPSRLQRPCGGDAGRCKTARRTIRGQVEVVTPAAPRPADRTGPSADPRCGSWNPRRTGARPLSAAGTAAGSAPATWIRDPSSDNSPSDNSPSDTATSDTAASTPSAGTTSTASRSASAIGRPRCNPLGQVGGREVDRDAACGQRDGHRGQGRAHPFARLRNRLVREPDDGKGGNAGGHGALHFDKAGLDPLECDGIGARDHAGPRNFTSPG